LSYVSSKRRKEFLVLTCGQSASLSKGKTEDEMGLSDESEDEETVSLTTSAYSIQGFPMGIMNVFKIMPFIQFMLFIHHYLFINWIWLLYRVKFT
jgi:hypothetical protein